MTFKTLNINLLVFYLFAIISKGYSQNSLNYTEEDFDYRKGVEFFQIEKYASSQEYFQRVIEHYGKEHTDIKADAEYYLALCAINLFNDDAEYRITQFIAKYPESPRTRMAYFEMGKFKYRKEKYDQALYYFDKVWKQNLSKEDLNEYYFKKGYSYFMTGEIKKSTKMFYELLDKDSKYSGPGNYYYSHTAYLDKNYETALKGFTKLEDDPTFAPVVPYYKVHIYYLQGKKEKVLDYGPKLLEADTKRREAEISRLVGEVMYKDEKYQESLHFLEKYKESAQTYTREDIYQLGYTYYMTTDYEKAVSTLSNVTNVDDALTQNSYFHMADCYLKMNKKGQALKAFEAASKLDFDGEIKEVSLLNYAKLSYELSFSPFNETIKAFDNYLSSYPNSIHKDEANSYLVKVYLTSKNYKEALESLSKIKVKSPEMIEAHQRVAFYRGLELFNNLKFAEALNAFEESLAQRAFDRKMHSLTIYWKAEALYRLDKYKKAAEAYNEFLLTPGAYSQEEYNTSYYNLGYCYFKQKEYKEAISWFRKYIDKASEVDPMKLGDAYIRTADCYFVERQYSDAIGYYGKAQELDKFDADYAIFQKGFSLGLVNQYQKKNETLSMLINDKPKSTYAPVALYERAFSYVALDQTNPAINDFERLIKTYPTSIYKVKTLLQLGLLYYGSDNYEQALKNYKQVVVDYPGTTEAKDALLGIKNIYVDMNKVEDYVAFADKYSSNSVSLNEKDSLTYMAAEKVYMTGNRQLSAKLFDDYLSNYPSGKFTINAHYYRGDCYLAENKEEKALQDFNFIVEKPKNIFTEQSLLNSAIIYEKQNSDSLAYEHYKKLEHIAEIKLNLLTAREGQMDLSYKLQKYNLAVESAKRVLITDKVSEEQIRKSRLIMAKSYKKQGLLDLSLVQFRILAADTKNKEGAEAKYRVAETLFEQANIDMAEKTIIEYVDMGTPHQYWLAKSFLLWSDIYLQKDDSFQAKANLQSVIENYGLSKDGIIKEAEEKLNAIVLEENKQFDTNNTESRDSIQIDNNNE